METLHTRGPWNVANVNWISSATTQQTICAMYAVKSGLDHSESDANARLIAAAPELLAALQWFIENDDTNLGDPYNEFWEDGLNRGISAVAKATGAKE